MVTIHFILHSSPNDQISHGMAAATEGKWHVLFQLPALAPAPLPPPPLPPLSMGM